MRANFHATPRNPPLSFSSQDCAGAPFSPGTSVCARTKALVQIMKRITVSSAVKSNIAVCDRGGWGGGRMRERRGCKNYNMHGKFIAMIIYSPCSLCITFGRKNADTPPGVRLQNKVETPVLGRVGFSSTGSFVSKNPRCCAPSLSLTHSRPQSHRARTPG